MYPVLLGVSIADRIETDFMNSNSGNFDLSIRNNTNLPIEVAEKMITITEK
jgi:hypothetical protein